MDKELYPVATVYGMSAKDSVGLLIEGIGWFAIAIAFGGMILMVNAADNSYDSDFTTMGAFIFGIVGSLGGIFTVGTGRIIRYVAETAAQSRRAADLLEIAVTRD